MINHLNTMNIKQAKKAIIKCFASNTLPPLLLSEPGVGKSSIVRQIAEEKHFEFIDIRLATHDVCDLTGLPRFIDNRAEFIPFDLFPLEDTPLPEGKLGFIILLDEITSCSRAMQVAAYRILLDREVGNHKLHPNCFLVAAGNRAEDKAVVNDLSTALKSRMITIRIEAVPNVWVEYASKYNIDERIISFILANPDMLSNFDPESKEDAYACPRSWEALNKILRTFPDIKKGDDLPLFSGVIGQTAANLFLDYCELYKNMLTLEEILKDPTLASPPSERSMQWACICSLASQLSNMEPEGKEFTEITTKFIPQFDMPMQILFWRILINKKPSILSSKALQGSLKHIMELLGEEDD